MIHPPLGIVKYIKQGIKLYLEYVKNIEFFLKKNEANKQSSLSGIKRNRITMMHLSNS